MFTPILQLPESLYDDLKIDLPTCKFWAVRFENGMDQRVMEHILITPIMDLLDDDMKSQVYSYLVFGLYCVVLAFAAVLPG